MVLHTNSENFQFVLKKKEQYIAKWRYFSSLDHVLFNDLVPTEFQKSHTLCCFVFT